ncbi:TolB family protein [Mycetocola zhadangensis]|uniref:TolB-like translocation protein n=1 Tax=Mycetocola zhadangensis TaxID=1164595 RepID=A0A3L7J529_9MICO|nr:hypothetical protein [Mycetocola zhadangensis]RLQ84581.1 hypothetical protein D9V28_10480 [Mycetocola zhadangensis]GGE91683.1 TolB-like translocation protein; signal peptide [Mycetocola zhadangensis]
MTSRRQWLALAIVSVLLLGGAVAYGATAYARYQARSAAPSDVRTTNALTTTSEPHIVFRNTAQGQGYGKVATVPVEAPSAARALTDQACDRVYATGEVLSCLRIQRGVPTTFRASVFDRAGAEVESWPLPGIPSRTRMSQDGSLVATTSFVTGHSYATTGFSTETVVSQIGGESFGNLEDFALWIDGEHLTAADRNIWGVTFAADDNTFYATAASGGRTWLVNGNLAERTLTAITNNAECPSLSPDGSRVAYKKNSGTPDNPHWGIAVLNLTTEEEVVLPEVKNVDDQVEWLDDSTLLYGLAREGAVGDSDVWSIASDGATEPSLFIEHAWSPSVVTK